MTTLRKFLRLAAAERRLVARTFCLLALIRFGLQILPVRKVHALVAHGTRRRESAPCARHHSVERIVWAVRAAAPYVPGASCLPQALTAHAMLTRHGHPAQVHIGMAMTECRVLAGHAWVESNGCVVLGGDVARYMPVPVLDANQAGAG